MDLEWNATLGSQNGLWLGHSMMVSEGEKDSQAFLLFFSSSCRPYFDIFRSLDAYRTIGSGVNRGLNSRGRSQGGYEIVLENIFRYLPDSY